MMTGSDLSANPKILNARWQCQSQMGNSVFSLVVGGDFGRGLASPTSQCSSGLVVAEMVVCAWGGLEYACIMVIKNILELVTENSGRGRAWFYGVNPSQRKWLMCLLRPDGIPSWY